MKGAFYMNNTILDSIDKISEITSECSLDCVISLINAYNKADYIMENYHGNDIEGFHLFQEGKGEFSNTIKSVGSKIVNVIREMIQKLCDFMKKTFNKIFKKSPSTITQKISDTVNDIKNNKDKSKIAIAISTIGLTTAVTAGGIIFYNKHKQKKFGHR